MEVLSFRIHEFDLGVLKTQARKKEITVSALVNGIVSNWVDSLIGPDNERKCKSEEEN